MLLNNLGGLTPIEMGILKVDVIKDIGGRGFKVERIFSGPFCTSLDMKGFSITILSVDDNTLGQLDVAVGPSGWVSGETPQEPALLETAAKRQKTEKESAPSEKTELGKTVEAVIMKVMEDLNANVDELNRLDAIVGDGDCGMTVGRGAKGLSENLSTMPVNNVPDTLGAVSRAVQGMGGSSGALYGCLMGAASANLKGGDCQDLKFVASALKAAVARLSQYSGAVRGDRTMLDSLFPAADAFESSVADGGTLKDALTKAAEAAAQGAENTLTMGARAGRASYVDAESLKKAQDPGAVCVSIWLKAIAATV